MNSDGKLDYNLEQTSNNEKKHHADTDDLTEALLFAKQQSKGHRNIKSANIFQKLYISLSLSP